VGKRAWAAARTLIFSADFHLGALSSGLVRRCAAVAVSCGGGRSQVYGTPPPPSPFRACTSEESSFFRDYVVKVQHGALLNEVHSLLSCGGVVGV
jgi:hypothetical protein